MIANTGDDIEILGVRRLPRSRPRHLLALPARSTRSAAGESRTTASPSSSSSTPLGAPDWFRLSDRDLATCLYRTDFLAEGGTLTAAQAQIAAALGVRARVLPMCERAGPHHGRDRAGARELQEFLILDRGEGAIDGVELHGIEAARPTAGGARGDRAAPSDRHRRPRTR